MSSGSVDLGANVGNSSGGSGGSGNATSLQGVAVSATPPNDGEALIYSSGASQWAPTALSGGGNVTSSGGSTANAIVRFSGTSGTAIKNSSIILSDVGGLLGISTLTTGAITVDSVSGFVKATSGVYGVGSVSLVTDVTGNLPLTQTSGSISLTTQVSGLLPVAFGGTNSSGALSNKRFIISSANAIIESIAVTPNAPLRSNADGTPTVGSVSLLTDVIGSLSSNNINVTNMTWQCVGSWSYTGGSVSAVDFINLFEFRELAVTMQAVTTQSTTIRFFLVSGNNGSTFISGNNIYMYSDGNGATSDLFFGTPHFVGTTSPRWSLFNITPFGGGLTGKKIVNGPVPQTIADQSALNAIRFSPYELNYSTVNYFTGGNITVWGRK